MKKKVNLKFAFTFLLLWGIYHTIQSQDPTYRIYGKIHVPKAEGTILIHLVDREYFDIPLSGLDTIELKASSKKLEYEFRNTPSGTYGIKCFQDLNGNGKLDKGLFGPSEPWALSWKGKKRFPPRFEDISFILEREKQYDIQLKK